MKASATLEIVRLGRSHVAALSAMLGAIKEEGMDKWFVPHTSDRAHLESLCNSEKRDLLYVMTFGGDVIGYGLLRGWDEGFEVPSLGIAIHPEYRSKGLGLALMEFLHAAAALRGCKQVRLRVYRDNAVAIALYRRMGYRFEEPKCGEPGEPIVGFKQL